MWTVLLELVIVNPKYMHCELTFWPTPVFGMFCSMVLELWNNRWNVICAGKLSADKYSWLTCVSNTDTNRETSVCFPVMSDSDLNLISSLQVILPTFTVTSTLNELVTIIGELPCLVLNNRQNCINNKVYFGKYMSVPGQFWSLVLEDYVKNYEDEWTLIYISSKMQECWEVAADMLYQGMWFCPCCWVV